MIGPSNITYHQYCNTQHYKLQSHPSTFPHGHLHGLVVNSTSSILGKGKPSFMKMVQISKDTQIASEIMTDYWATEEKVGEAAVKISLEMYGGTKDYSLRKWRYILLKLFSVLKLVWFLSIKKRTIVICFLHNS